MATPRWDTLWTNARIATMRAGRYAAIAPGAIAARAGVIDWVGPSAGLPAEPRTLAREVRDVGGRWITPGLMDCHTHLVYAGNRAREFELRLQGATYEALAQAGGGIVSTVAATRAVREEVLEAQSMRRLRALLDEGVTTIEIKSGYGLRTDAELKQLRVARRLGAAVPVTVRTTFLGAHTVPSEFAGRADAYVAYVCDEMLPAVADAGLADAVDAFCEGIAFSPAQTARVFERAGTLGLPVKLHADQLSDLGGAALAARFRALSADHLEYTSETGVRALAEAGTVAVLLPGAFYFLRESRVPPVQLLQGPRRPDRGGDRLQSGFRADDLAPARAQHGVHAVPPHARRGAGRCHLSRRERARDGGHARFARTRKSVRSGRVGDRRAGRARLFDRRQPLRRGRQDGRPARPAPEADRENECAAGVDPDNPLQRVFRKGRRRHRSAAKLS